jgi:hypothetical protein
MEEVYTTKEMLEKIEVHVLRVEGKLDSVIAKGCALAPERDRRIRDLQDAQRRGVWVIISSLLTAIGGLTLAIINLLG